MNFDRAWTAIASTLLITLWSIPAWTNDFSEQKLQNGQVVTFYQKSGDINYVVGKIRVRQPAERIWTILANPFEFQEKISPHFKTVRVIEDRNDISILQCKVDFGFFLPSINYTVESHYDACRRILFQSKEGDIKDFRGCWEIIPTSDGKACDVAYSMYVNPGFPVPQWFVRQAIRSDLPKTLSALAQRIDAVYKYKDPLVRRSLVSAATTIQRI